MTQFDLFVFAGETSGDRLGAPLLREIKKRRPSLKIAAVAGKEMRKENPHVVLQTEEFEVMGFFQVFLSIFSLVKKFFFLKRWILKHRPKVLVFIDYPGFNLRMQKALRKNGYRGKIIHYVCPTVWAWGKKRINLMEKTLDELLVLFPFEKKCFTKRSLPVKYVGHPLAFAIVPYVKMKKEKFSIGLFPGSRIKEIENNLPFHFDTVKRLLDEGKDIDIYLSVSHEKFLPLIEKIMQRFPMLKNVHLFLSHPYQMMKKIDIALATSGTINLELALHLIPTIVTFYINKVETFIGKNILRIILPYYCIVNICQQKEIFPELYGLNLTKERLYFLTKNLIEDEKLRQKCKLECEGLKKTLYTPNPATVAAENVLSFLSF